MLNIKVHGVKEADAQNLEVAILKDDKGVVLAAVDKDGKVIANGTIVRITSDGQLVRLPALSAKLGLKLNPKGQVLMLKNL
jgi:hypothetical protein